MKENGEPALVIERANSAQIDAAWSIVSRCRAALDRAGIHQWDDVYPSRSTVAEDVDRECLYVAMANGICQATITLDAHEDEAYRTMSWSSDGPALVVHRLCVDPAHQGQGIARRMMRFAEQHASAHGYTSIRLDAYTANPRSVELYRRLGYREVGQVSFPRRALPFLLFERLIATNHAGHR